MYGTTFWWHFSITVYQNCMKLGVLVAASSGSLCISLGLYSSFSFGVTVVSILLLRFCSPFKCTVDKVVTHTLVWYNGLVAFLHGLIAKVKHVSSLIIIAIACFNLPLPPPPPLPSPPPSPPPPLPPPVVCPIPTRGPVSSQLSRTAASISLPGTSHTHSTAGRRTHSINPVHNYIVCI